MVLSTTAPICSRKRLSRKIAPILHSLWDCAIWGSILLERTKKYSDVFRPLVHFSCSIYDSSWWFPLLDLDIETFGIISSSSNRALDFENLGEQEVKTSLKTLRSDCCNAFNIRDINLHNFCLFGTSPSSISMCHLTKARKIPQLILNFWRECWWSWCFERPKAPGRKGQLWTWLKFWLCISSWSVSRW